MMSALAKPLADRKLLVINPNTNGLVTRRVRLAVQACASPQTMITVVNPDSGPFAIETPQDRSAAAPHVLDLVQRWSDHDGCILACFDDIAIAEARAILRGPVISMAEAGIRAAAQLYRRFDVITTVGAAVPTISDLVATYGLSDRCQVRATGIGVSDTAAATTEAETALGRAIALSRQTGANAIVLGSGAFAGRRQKLSEAFGLPFIDGLEAAVAFCERGAAG